MSITVEPGVEFQAILLGAPKNLSGYLGFGIADPASGSYVTPRRTTGITEGPQGTYTTTEVAPVVADNYTIVWDYLRFSATEPLFVFIGYASVDTVRDYAPELADRADEEIMAEIKKAEKDIDWYAGFSGAIDEVTGLRFVPLTDLDPRYSEAVTRATSAQVQYRFYMGPAFTTDELQYEEVQGRDQTVRKAQRVGPQARSEFPAGLRKLTGKFA